MKICFLTHNLKQDNGAGVFSLRLIEGMRYAFHADIIVCSTEQSGMPFEIPLNKGFLRNIFIVRRIVRECDIVHALDVYPYGVLAAFALLGMRKKFIITAIGTGAVLHLYKPLHSFFLWWAYTKADAVTTVSNFSKKEILKKMPDLHISVITHGVDFDEWQNSKVRPEILSRIKEFKPYIISVGAIRTRKGYNLSIRSFAKVKKRFPDLTYVIVGKHYGKHFYKKMTVLIHELHLERSVFILENIESRDDLAILYRHAELFCLLSRSLDNDFEAFGLVFLEAAACGLPVVGTIEGGVPDAVQNGVNGILVDLSNIKSFYNSNEIDSFAKAIIAILSNPARKERMKVASLAFARLSDWKEKMNGYEDIYKKLL